MMKKRRSTKKIILGLVIICLVVFAFSFLVGYNIGFGGGHTKGYGAGYAEGYDNGHQLGHSEGYAVGYDTGLDEGYQLGHSEGYTTGYENGYDTGLDLGRSHGYNIMDPTYLEMRYFISRDKTDKNEYIVGKYMCCHFAADVCKNAEDENIRCAYVTIDFVEVMHAIVAFNTVDRGLIFIEPQTDEEMKIEIGEPYWPRDRYLPPDYDDTVEYVLVIW